MKIFNTICEKKVYIVLTSCYMNNKLFNFAGYKKIKEILKQKGLNISTLDNPRNISDSVFKEIVRELNTRPRKTLGFASPVEVFLQDRL